MSASSQSLHFILSLRINLSFITSRSDFCLLPHFGMGMRDGIYVCTDVSSEAGYTCIVGAQTLYEALHEAENEELHVIINP